jgi:hypothetical protein
MAKPRVFVSSTFYDLRTVRADLDHFIKEMGYEPVLFEKGHIPYGREDPLENYCYKEISNCDIAIVIIGGQYGTTSSDKCHSITHKELEKAQAEGKQVYIFVEKNVLSEYQTYKNNKALTDFKPFYVSNVKVFELIEQIYSLQSNNVIEPFEISEDIVRFLREQWAGLFQSLLQQSKRQAEISSIENLKETATMLDKMVKFLKEQSTQDKDKLNEIILSNHPAFSAIKKVAKIQYRVVFYNFDELNKLLNARSYKAVMDDAYYYWQNNDQPKQIRVIKSIFSKDNKLLHIDSDQWNDDYIKEIPFTPPPPKQADDDVPF